MKIATFRPSDVVYNSDLIVEVLFIIVPPINLSASDTQKRTGVQWGSTGEESRERVFGNVDAD